MALISVSGAVAVDFASAHRPPRAVALPDLLFHVAAALPYRHHPIKALYNGIDEARSTAHGKTPGMFPVFLLIAGWTRYEDGG